MSPHLAHRVGSLFLELTSGFGAVRKRDGRRLSRAHELSGLGSTRVVRFSASARRRIDEPDNGGVGPENAEVQGCFEPLGAGRNVDDGRGGSAGDVGTAVPALPRAVRGGGGCRSARSASGEGLAEAHRGGGDCWDAGALSNRV